MDSFSDVQQSFGRCLREHEDFIGTFYDRFLKADTRIQPMFSKTDFGKQRRLLQRGISLAITFAGTPSVARRQLTEIAEIHARKGRAPVDPALYGIWIESLIHTVAEADPRFNEKLEQRWRQALDPAIDYIKGSY